MNKQLIEIQLFGPIISFAGIHKTSHIQIEQYESYQKMGYRNRFQILTSNGMQNITIPVKGGRDQKRPTWSVEVDYNGKWVLEHWRTLESAYNRSPFFEHYSHSLRNVWQQQPVFLWQFCHAALQWTLGQLKWQGEISQTETYSKNHDKTILDCRNQFLPKKRESFPMPEYQQQFGNRFESNLSVLDLLFNCGPQAINYLNSLDPALNLLPSN